MGFLNVLKSVASNSSNISSVIKLLNGKVDASSLATILSTYLQQSKQASTASAAKTQANSMASQIASAINLSQCSSVADVVSKLTASEKSGTTELANILSAAIKLIRSLNTKA